MKIKAYYKNWEYWVLFNERADDIILADEAVVTTATPEQVKILTNNYTDWYKAVVREILASNK